MRKVELFCKDTAWFHFVKGRLVKLLQWNCFAIDKLGMFYVYIIRSVANRGQRYFGYTKDLRKRLNDHNSGKSAHTAGFRPWELETYVAFSDKQKALDFERYLKTGAGRGFSKRRF